MNFNNGFFSDSALYCIALYLASQNGHKEVVKFISELPIPTNGRDMFQLTGFFLAAKNGNLEVLRDFARNGVQLVDDVNINPCAKGETSRKRKLEVVNEDCADIFEAVKKGRMDELKQFVNKEKGASLNSVTEERNSPLHLACRSGCIHVVELLVKKKADVNAKNREGNTPLHLAVKNAFQNIVEFLLKSGADVNAKNNNDEVVLVWANDDDVINLLINKGANYKYIGRRGKCLSALHFAAELNNEILVQNLLNRGFKVDSKDYLGRTALMYAAQQGNCNIIEILLGNGANINKQGRWRINALQQAVIWGHFQAAEKLLQKSSEIDLMDNNFWTPLMRAAHRGHVQIVNLLLFYGANKELRDRENRSALDIARRWKHKEIVKLLE